MASRLLKDRLALLDGLHHLDILALHRLNLQGILIEHHQIRQFAHLQQALGRLLAVLLGLIDCLRVRARSQRHPAAQPRLPGPGGPQPAQLA